MSSLWTDTVWEDPDGGRVIVHGTMPTVVYPNAMRPRATWHGLALLESPDVVDLWIQEEADEAESQGINLTHALLSGGAFGKYIEGIETLEALQGGRFPDPEPRRLQRNADRHGRAVFFIEPLADDEDWGDYLTQEAKSRLTLAKITGHGTRGEAMEKERQATSVQRSTPAQGPIRGLFDSERVGRCLVGTLRVVEHARSCQPTQRALRCACTRRPRLASFRPWR